MILEDSSREEDLESAFTDNDLTNSSDGNNDAFQASKVGNVYNIIYTLNPFERKRPILSAGIEIGR